MIGLNGKVPINSSSVERLGRCHLCQIQLVTPIFSAKEQLVVAAVVVAVAVVVVVAVAEAGVIGRM